MDAILRDSKTLNVNKANKQLYFKKRIAKKKGLHFYHARPFNRPIAVSTWSAWIRHYQ